MWFTLKTLEQIDHWYSNQVEAASKSGLCLLRRMGSPKIERKKPLRGNYDAFA